MGSLFSVAEIKAMSGGIRPPAPRDYVLPSHFPNLSKFKRVAIDLESHDESLGAKTGPGWRRDAYIVGVSVAGQSRDGSIPYSEYYPIGHKVGPNLDKSQVLRWLEDELLFYQGDVVGANLLYDGDGLQYQNIEAPLAKWRDVQWAEALIDESSPNYQLNRLAQKYLSESKVTDELKGLYGPGYKERMEEIHPGHMRKYGVGDVTLPLRILDEQYKVLRKEKIDDLFDIECRLTPFLLYMRKQGVRVDIAKAASLETMFVQKRDAALRQASKECGVELNADNFGKPTVLELVFSRLGIKPPRTEAGTISIKDAWLERLDHPIGDLLLTANKMEKAKSTFVDGYITDCAVGDRVHCEFHPLRRVDDEAFGGGVNGTVSGRFSGANPNLQNIPARDEVIGPLCRSLFIADEDAEWWSQDYSQIEYRFLVHYAVELHCKAAEKAQQEYLSSPDTDFHEMCAKLIWHTEWAAVGAQLLAGEITKEKAKKLYKALRGPAKNLNFGMVYGMGVEKLAASLGMIGPDGKPTKEAMDIMAAYHEGAPFIRDLNKKCTTEASEKGYITTIGGRRSRFDLWEPKFQEKGKKREMPLPEALAREKWGSKIKRSMTHKALNRRLQGSAADLMKVAMVNLWESGVFDRGNDITCTLTVHDELNGSFVPSARGKAALREVKRIMETAMSLHVPVLTSGSTGANWAEAK